MDERLRFVARLLDGEKMAVLCREFDISRKTGYKIFNRYKDCGLEGLTDRSRRPYRHANQLPFQIEKRIVQLKQEHPSWGAPKIREKLRRLDLGIQCPPSAPCMRCWIVTAWSAAVAAHALHGAGHRPVHAQHAERTLVRRLQGRVHARRPALLLSAHHHRLRQPVSARAARRWPRPRKSTRSPRLSGSLRSSACPARSAPTTACPSPARALFGLSKLSVWWLRLGIASSASSPATRSRTAATNACTSRSRRKPPSPPAKNFLQQQAHFDDFIERFNHERPAPGARHAVPGRALPALTASLSGPRPSSSTRSTTGPSRSPSCGRICFGTPKINLEQSLRRPERRRQTGQRPDLAGQLHGLRLRFFDDETCRLECAENPFGAKVLPMSPE